MWVVLLIVFWSIIFYQEIKHKIQHIVSRWSQYTEKEWD